MDTGSLIRDYRKKHGITGAELADKLGVSAQYLGQVENKHKKASMNLVKKLVKATGETYEYWISDDQYATLRKELEKTNNLIDTLIDNNLIKEPEDIFRDGFQDALKAALLADVYHKLELKRLKNKEKQKKSGA